MFFYVTPILWASIVSSQFSGKLNDGFVVSAGESCIEFPSKVKVWKKFACVKDLFSKMFELVFEDYLVSVLNLDLAEMSVILIFCNVKWKQKIENENIFMPAILW